MDMQDRIDHLTRHRDKLLVENQELLNELAGLLQELNALRARLGEGEPAAITPDLPQPPL